MSGYWEKIPFLILHLHTLIYNSFYGLWRYMVKRKFTFNFEFWIFFITFTLQWKANVLIMELIVSFSDDIEVSLSQLMRFNESVIDLECLLKIAATSFCLITFYLFQATLYFLVYYCFYLRSTVYMLSKLVWDYNQY